ncbi:MAG: 1,4-dihydroxy-2-naphthoate octaprenyltransferase [Candidatus Heimdallarchaeota archaeon]|nr:MAG: 1,4-dihydroxy-2-naphthoate octaprenyltransferase [Candidatus Heimdallarchaeota archaeon]
MADLIVNVESDNRTVTPSFTNRILIWVLAIRAPFFTASIVPLVLGMAIAWYDTQIFDPLLGFLTLLAGVAIHAGTNLANDYFDQPTDDINQNFSPFNGGSRMIQNNVLLPRQILLASIFCYLVGIVTAVFIIINTGGILLLFFLGTAVLLGLFYTALPVRLSYHGLGEIAVFVGFGPLGVLSAYYIQLGNINWTLTLIASVPIAFLIAMVLFINEFQDIEADQEAGKRTLVVVLGKTLAVRIYIIGMILAYVFLLIGVISAVFPVFLLLPFFTIPLAAKAILTAKRNYMLIEELQPANATTILTHFTFGIMMALAFILA